MSKHSLAHDAVDYFRDPDVALWRKLTGLAALAYTAWPLDAIPDVVPGLGWLDDVGVLGAATFFIVRSIQKHGARRSALLTRPGSRP